MSGGQEGGQSDHPRTMALYAEPEPEPEPVQVSGKAEVQSDEEVSAFRASVLKVLMGTLN